MKVRLFFLSYINLMLFLLLTSTAHSDTYYYQYDDLHRLARVEQSDGSVTVYEYDDLGNRTSMAITSSSDIIYYCDSDIDGYYDESISGTCTSGPGCPPANCQTTQGNDCNDDDALEHPGQTWYADVDGDGYSDGTTNTISCTRPVGYKISTELTATSGDCNDNDSTVHPGATEGPTGDPTCSDTKDNDCDGLTDNADENCEIIISNYSLNIVVVGQGTVTSSPAGIDCGSDCSESYPYGSGVTLSAAPLTDWQFDGWSGGGCSGIGDCAVTMNADVTITATFTYPSQIVLQPDPANGVDVWITSVYYDGGEDNEYLRIGGWGDYYYSLIKFDLTGLPSDIISATIYLYAYQETNNTSMYLDRVTTAWDENTRWPDNPSYANMRTIPSPTVDSWYSIDITDIYNAWKDGSWDNYGIQLRPTDNWNKFNKFHSSDYIDDPSLRPKLVIVRSVIDYYCDGDNDSYIASSFSGACSGSNCEPQGCQLNPGNDCDDTASSCTNDCTTDTDIDGRVDCLDVCTDLDGDGYGDNEPTTIIGNGTIPVGSCTTDSVTPCNLGEACLGLDCNDNDNAVYPGAMEICNGLDDNCINGTDEGGNDLCDNGLYCDGQETCDGINGCQSGTSADCNDGIGCTNDSCNEGTDTCSNIPNDAYCTDDGQYCNGTEYCDLINDCVSEGDPCFPDGCNEVTDTCEQWSDFKILKTRVAPMLDGYIAEYNNADSITFADSSSGNIITVKALWDETALYLAYEVFDTKLNTSGGDVWSDDSVEWGIDTLNDGGDSGNLNAVYLLDDDYHGIVNILETQYDEKGDSANPTIPISPMTGSWDAKVQKIDIADTFNENEDSDVGYTVEVRIPWTTLNLYPVGNEWVGMSFLVNDRSASGSVNHAMWPFGGGDAFPNAENWQQVVLSDEYAFSILKTPVAPSIDGFISEYINARSVELQLPSEEDTAIVKVLWDETALYLAYEVYDTQLNTSGGDVWSDDSVEWGIDTINDGGDSGNPNATYLLDDDYHGIVNILETQYDEKGDSTSPAIPISPILGTWDARVQKMYDTDTFNNNTDIDAGYTVELKIPWSTLNYSPVGNEWVGMGLLVSDKDASACNVDPEGTYIEAEKYSDTISQGSSDFVEENVEIGYLGTGYLRSNGAGSSSCPPADEGKEYRVNFTSTGTYKVWIRGFAVSGSSDSIFIGIDGTCVGSLSHGGIFNEWIWTNTLKSGANTITIPSSEFHKINIWIRENGHLVDGIYITKGDETPDDTSHGVESDPNTCDSLTTMMWPSGGGVSFQNAANWQEVLLSGSSMCLSPARIAGAVPVYYYTLQEACNDVLDVDTIQVQDVQFYEDFILNADNSINIQAGYDCSYLSNSGVTTINGDMTISDGTVIIQSGTLEIR